MPNAFILLEASTGKETINGILSEQPDLVFLDIKMTDMTGFEVIEHLPKEKIPSLIFVTAYNHFALQAFEVQALDYLLKPFKKERFLEALERGLQRIELDQIKHFQENVKGLIRLLEKSKDNPWAEKESYLDKVVLKLNKKYFFWMFQISYTLRLLAIMLKYLRQKTRNICTEPPWAISSNN